MNISASHARLTRRPWPVLTAAVLTAALVGCGGGPSESPQRAWPAPITAPGPSDIDSADDIAAAAMREMHTERPSTEQPGDPTRRTRPWLSPALAARLTQGDVADPITHASVQWRERAHSQASIDATVMVSRERPPHEAPGRAERKVAVTQTVTWPDHRQQRLNSFTILVTLAATGDGWRVDDIRR
ncbi:hypothetical protein ACIGO9_30685 [Nocardia asteroides]|uniref:hypothetical protein n=1 Tax=Nocardia asteroides TaxID=1824 RepID=UPI0037C769BA